MIAQSKLFAFIFLLVTATLAHSATPERAVNQTERATISLWDVLVSTLEHHPQIVRAQADIEAATGKQLAAQGSFDWELENTTQSRIDGFYDGDYFAQNLARRLPWANTKISAGYRLSDGIFPVYEDIHRTRTGGEINFKVSTSLLRGRDIDPDRDLLNQTDLERQISEDNALLTLNSLLLDASYQFLSWYRSEQEVHVTEQLLQLAQDRHNAIQKRVERGNLADFDLTESLATLMQRREALLRAQQHQELVAERLSLYLRNHNGEPTRFNTNTSAVAPNLEMVQDRLVPSDFFTMLSEHPKVTALDHKIQQWQSSRRLAHNERLPQLDVEMVVANDFGRGSETLNDVETYMGLSFSVPIQQRKARGKINEAEAKIRGLEHERQQLLETMGMDMQTAFISLDNLNELYDLHEQQASVAERLASMELQRFNAGDSDLFLLNAREQSNGIAQLELINTRIDILLQTLAILAKGAVLVDVVEGQFR